MNILVTGGAGYIGSHTLVCLLDADHRVVVLDNLANASKEALRRVEAITGKSLIFVQGDVQDIVTLNTVFETQAIDAVIHFAALKAVGESALRPLQYYQTNVHGSLCLLNMAGQG